MTAKELWLSLACIFVGSWTMWSWVDPFEAVRLASFVAAVFVSFVAGIALRSQWARRDFRAYVQRRDEREERRAKHASRRCTVGGDWAAEVQCADGHGICVGRLGELIAFCCPVCVDEDKQARSVVVVAPKGDS